MSTRDAFYDRHASAWGPADAAAEAERGNRVLSDERTENWTSAIGVNIIAFRVSQARWAAEDRS